MNPVSSSCLQISSRKWAAFLTWEFRCNYASQAGQSLVSLLSRDHWHTSRKLKVAAEQRHASPSRVQGRRVREGVRKHQRRQWRAAGKSRAIRTVGKRLPAPSTPSCPVPQLDRRKGGWMGVLRPLLEEPQRKEEQARNWKHAATLPCQPRAAPWPGRYQTSKPFLGDGEVAPGRAPQVRPWRSLLGGWGCRAACSFLHDGSAAVVLPRAAAADGIRRDPVAGSGEPGTVVTVHSARDGLLYSRGSHNQPPPPFLPALWGACDCRRRLPVSATTPSLTQDPLTSRRNTLHPPALAHSFLSVQMLLERGIQFHNCHCSYFFQRSDFEK